MGDVAMKRRCVRAPTAARCDVPRDIETLRSLAWARFLTTSQIAALHFPSRRVAQRRLRALFDHGLIRTRLQGEAVLHRDSLHALSAAGARLLEERGTANDIARPGRFPAWRALPHATAIRDVFVAFRSAERDGRIALDDVLFEGDLVRVPTLVEAGLIPDLLVTIRTASGERRIAVEVDLGTEPNRVLKAKLDRYATLIGAGFCHEVLFVLGGARRLLESLVAESGIGGSVRRVRREDVAALLDECSHGPYAPPVRAERTPVFRQRPAAPRLSPPPDAALKARAFTHATAATPPPVTPGEPRA